MRPHFADRAIEDDDAALGVELAFQFGDVLVHPLRPVVATPRFSKQRQD